MREPLDLDAIRARAERQAAAYARMLELNGGCGLLGVRHPEMFEDMHAWGDSTENDHADTVLALIAEVERLRAAHDLIARVPYTGADVQQAVQAFVAASTAADDRVTTPDLTELAEVYRAGYAAAWRVGSSAPMEAALFGVLAYVRALARGEAATR